MRTGGRDIPRRSGTSTPGSGAATALGLVAATGLALIGLVGLLAFPASEPPPRLPEPTGSHAVGTTLLRWADSSRSIAGGSRELPVRVWYPAAPAERKAAPYVLQLESLRPVLGDAYVRRLERVEPHAILEPPVAPTEIPFPVVVLSHGLASLPSLYTTLAEELTSHGWVVFAPAHPGGARGVVTSDGRAIPLASEWSEPGTHEELFARTVRTWSRDQRFLIDRIQALATGGTGASFLAGRLDGERIATVGHSLGASSALLTAQTDPDVGAAVALEGTVRSLHLGLDLTRPLLVMTKDPDLLRREQTAQSLGLPPERLDRFLARLDENADRLREAAAMCVPLVRVRRAHHNHFGDQSMVFGEPAGLNDLVDARRAARLVSAHVLAFLDRSLGRAHGGLSRLENRFPEAERIDHCPRDAPAEEGLRPIRATELFVKVFGAGEAPGPSETSGEPLPVIVVHGGPSLGHGYLLPGLLELAGERRLVFYDQRGIGRSAGAGDSASLGQETNLRDLEALRVSLSAPKIDLLGHSFGAGLAAAYAAGHPDRVRRLVLLNPVAPGRGHQAALRRTLESRRSRKDSVELASLFRSDGFRDGQRAVVDRIYRLTYRPWFADPALAARLSFGLDRETAERGRRVARIVVRNSKEYDPWAHVNGIRARTLVVHGAEDPVPVEGVRKLAGRIPNARYLVISGSGHFPWVEAPEAVYGEIRAFLGAVRAAR